MCGDSIVCFNDDKGNFVSLISDGMGTGGRAAVDSMMTVNLMEKLVKSGQAIAEMGSTGSSTGAHVHFEVIINGVPKNPMDYV